MSPQFVDFDADGHLDIVAGIFDGSPHVAFGTDAGWKQPEQILDRDGQRIVMNDFWNFDTKKWDATTRCDPEGETLPTGHLTSAWAADLDGDGDFDLLLGDHKSGLVCARINEGTNPSPAFATRNVPLRIDGALLRVPGTVTTLRLFDWDRDGRDDLLVGSMGDAYGTATGGGVFVHPNIGTAAAPAFGKPITLIAASPKGASEATRPDSGLYMDPTDLDGDGDIDLLVGGYSHWTPEVPTLSAEQQAQVTTLKAEIAALQKKQSALLKPLEELTAGADEATAQKKREEFLAKIRPELTELSGAIAQRNEQLEPLMPGAKRVSFVWWYENRAAAGDEKR